MARVFDRAAPELLLVAAHLTRQATGAEDIVQGTLPAAIEQRAQFDPARRRQTLHRQFHPPIRNPRFG